MSVQSQDDARLWVEKVVGHAVGDELTKLEAEQVTAKIKAYAKVAWLLLFEAHKRQAHKAMGYATWADYVEAEFDMSRSRSYQLISQARVVYEISEVVSTTVDINERQARDLAPHLDEAKAAAKAAVDALDDAATEAERAAAAEQAVIDLRASVEQEPPPGVDPTTGEKFAGSVGSPAPTSDPASDQEQPPDAHNGGAPEEAGEAQSPTDSASESSASTSPASEIEDNVASIEERIAQSDEAYLKAITAQRSRTRDGLLTIDIDRLAKVSDLAERTTWQAFSDDIRSWLDRLDTTLTETRHLRSTK